MTVTPFAWKNRPSLIERILPAQKISAEAQKERKANLGQTLTALGSYWKGRKPLILVKACVLGALLPATDDPEADLAIFEKLMAIDDETFVRRGFVTGARQTYETLKRERRIGDLEAERVFAVEVREAVYDEKRKRRYRYWSECFAPEAIDSLDADPDRRLIWHPNLADDERLLWQTEYVRCHDYLTRVSGAKRPEEFDQDDLFAPVWDDVNRHLGTSAASMPELIEQLGILRFGHRPKVGDTFCGGGSIPFEAARLGCDVYASDLNPIACMLTWGALNIVGADVETRREIERAQREAADAVDREITELGIEHDSHGNRAKAFLYCLETRCPQTGWMVPLAPSWVISKTRNVVARLIPDRAAKRFAIDIVSAVSEAEMAEADKGTARDGDLVYTLDGEEYRTPIKTIRGDYRLPDGTTGNKLRRWELLDFEPRPDDIFQERLYCIQWITKETLHKARPETFFAAVSEQDVARERQVGNIVRENLARWQEDGLVPDMPIEPGDETTRLGRERGWTYWHHLFNARQLLLHGKYQRHKKKWLLLGFANALDWNSKLSHWHNGWEKFENCFYNQALNTFWNTGLRASYFDRKARFPNYSTAVFGNETNTIVAQPAKALGSLSEVWITDPPYADAIRYEEITEFFIAWLRKQPPEPFQEWIWDSRRTLAIKGSGDEFRQEMIAAYKAMADHMPDNGLQIVMFTHQDARVWADMASIVWGAGLQVTAAWYIATETTSELKKGGYVQGTVLLVLRKRLQAESVYRDELVQEVRGEVAAQIETLVGLNQATKGHGRAENLFEDADLQMAGYAAALRVLTGYSRIDGQDMAAEALRPRAKGARDIVKEIIDFAVQVANEHLVPDGIPGGVWERLTGPERFYLKMLDIEAAGLKKIDNYQNFAKAFRYGDYGAVMASTKANNARLKTAAEFKRSEFEGEFGKSPLRALLFALYELQRETDIDEIKSHLKDLVPSYLIRREDLLALTAAIAAKREMTVPAEAAAARVLFTSIKNERLGG